ncbi:MAG: tetratricopeptide repeat protein [Phycisphaerae bacterium]
MRRSSNRMRGSVDYERRREDALRPCRYLGYDHDRLGIYLLDREALPLAESEFRRAVWLNPFEAEFRLHLAMCLFQQKRFAEAIPLATQVLEAAPQREDVRQFINAALSQREQGTATPPRKAGESQA